MNLFRIAILGWIFVGLFAVGTAADATASEVEIGSRVESLEAIDDEGDARSLLDDDAALATVVIFMGTDCPIGNLFIPELNRLHEATQADGVRWFGVYANASVDLAEMRRHRDKYDVAFPVLFDESQSVMENLGATRTPDAVVLDADNTIVYRGRIDNRFGYTFKQPEPDRADLEIAIQEVLQGQPVSISAKETMGCLITRRSTEADAAAPVTFANQIARIMQNNCQDCHHAGTAAPFSLMTYDDVSDHAEMIKEVVIDRRMPPWHADPDYGHFSNDLRMTQTEIDALVAWVDAGLPEGDLAMMPEPIEFADGWMIDEPDIVWEMPEEFQVPAEGVVEYKYWRMPSELEEDVWVQAAEARPGNRRVVHHIILYYVPPDAESRRDRVAIVGTAPGEEPVILPEGMGIRIPAGSELIWEMHYTPTGRAQSDRSQVGIVFCDEPPEREVSMDMAINHDFEIPANDDNFEVTATRTIKRDVELITFMPHMHLRGKDFKYVAHFPDGTERTLLSVPNYDFNWQHTYRFAEPYFIPAGTVIECIAHFDNSDKNPANPNPDRVVGWGDQTFDEMMIGFMKYVDASENAQQVQD